MAPRLLRLVNLYSSATQVADDFKALTTCRTNGRSSVFETKITVTNFTPTHCSSLRSYFHSVPKRTTGITPPGYGLVERMVNPNNTEKYASGGILNRVGRIIRKRAPQCIPRHMPKTTIGYRQSMAELHHSTYVQIGERGVVPRKKCRLENEFLTPSTVVIDPVMTLDGQEALLIAQRKLPFASMHLAAH